MNAQLVTDASVMAIWRRGKPDALPHHLLDESFLQRVGQPRHGKLLLVAENRADRPQGLRTRDAARADLFDYITRLYNTGRGHSTIRYLSAVEFQREVGLA